jgi:hypothetical protein
MAVKVRRVAAEPALTRLPHAPIHDIGVSGNGARQTTAGRGKGHCLDRAIQAHELNPGK